MATYVVKKDGSADAVTVAAAIAAANQNGDIVEIGDSEIYHENTLQVGAAITIRAAAGKSPQLDGDGGSVAGLQFHNAPDGCVVEDLVFTGYDGVFGYGSGAIMAASKMTVRGCTFRANAGTCVNYLEGSSGQHGVVDSCHAFNTGPLVFSTGSDYQDIVNCSVNPNDGASGVYPSGSNSTVTNCSFYVTLSAGTHPGMLVSAGTFTNCVAVATGAGVVASAFLSASQINNCCWYGFGNLQGGGGATVTDTINEDPKFTNAAGGVLTLEADSPCINAGITVAGVTADILGNSRPTGFYDIGAYEMDFAPGNPTIDSLKFIDKTTLRITFSEAMNQNADLSLAGNYTFRPLITDHDVSVSSVSVVSTTVVDLTVYGVKVNRRYTLSIGIIGMGG